MALVVFSIVKRALIHFWRLFEIAECAGHRIRASSLDIYAITRLSTNIMFYQRFFVQLQIHKDSRMTMLLLEAEGTIMRRVAN